MALRGQRFTLDPDSDNFTFNIQENDISNSTDDGAPFIGGIKERQTSGAPLPPKPKQTKTAFPPHRSRASVSKFKPKQSSTAYNETPHHTVNPGREPSDRAIVNHIGRKYGIDTEAKEKAEISEENKKRIAQMSVEDIEEARSEIMASMNPAFLEKFLKRANIEEDKVDLNWNSYQGPTLAPERNVPGEQAAILGTNSRIPLIDNIKSDGHNPTSQTTKQEPKPTPDRPDAQFHEVTPSIHFPVPPRNPEDYVPLDPNAPSFLADLKKHYFPELSHDPSTLAWLQDPTEEESKSSPYAPTQSRYAPSDIRFDFTGRLLAPNDSRDIPVSKGLHHHGEAPESAGYTVPELSILARSTLPNQRCVAYQVLGRILYRLGRGDFGQRGTELQEGLWDCVEKERPIEVMMSEANRTNGHVSAQAYATEALWLWRKGGGGERGLLKPGERVAK